MPTKCMPQEVGGWGCYLEEMAFKLNFDRTSIGREVGRKFKMRERHRSRKFKMRERLLEVQ